MPGRPLVASVLLGLAALGEATPCRAQANYRTAPIGGRSQLLGGTGMAYGMDASAGFLNPATAVLVDDTLLSFSVNFYLLSVVTSPHWYTPGPIDTQSLSVNSYQLPPALSPVGQGNYELLFVIAGSTSLRTIQRAVEDVREVVDPKKHPPKPAGETEIKP